MRKPIKNVGASVRQRLINLSRETGQNLELLLTRYAIERLLYRLGQSLHRDRFVLKGAVLVTTWFENPHRPTRDVDLLGFWRSRTLHPGRDLWRNLRYRGRRWCHILS